MPYFSSTNMKQYLAEVGFDLPIPLIGVDDGYDQINLAYWELRDGKLFIGEEKVKSRGKRGRHIGDFKGASVGLFSTGTETYTISESLQSAEDTRTDDYPKTPLNRFLVHAGLNKIGLSNGQGVAVVTGLPIKVYTNAAGNSRLIDAKTHNMLQPVTLGTNGAPSASIKFHSVYPEAIAGIVDYLFDEHGESIPGRDPNVVRMALDIGGNTTDMAIVLPGNEIGAVDTIHYGVSHMRDRLRTILENKFELKLDSITLDEALATRVLNLFGDTHDVAVEWETAISDVLVDLFSHAEKFRRQYPSIREMVCFGGGAALCHDAITKNFTNILMVDKPDGANARGFLKLASLGDLETIREYLAKTSAGADAVTAD